MDRERATKYLREIVDMPPSAVSIAKIKLLGSCFRNNSARVLGHDGAYSIPLSSGEVFWSFGDTLIGPERRGYDPRRIDIDTWVLKDTWAKRNISMISNSGLIAYPKDISKLMYGGFEYFVHKRKAYGKELVEAREIIPVPDKLKYKGKHRTAFWPVDGIEINGRLYFFYLIVTTVVSAINAYGTGVVRSTFPYKTFERLKSSRLTQPKKLVDPSELPFVWWGISRDNGSKQIPAFGTAVLKNVIDNYIYIYGSALEYRGDIVVHAVFLARVRKNDIEDVTKYEYLAEAPSKQNDFTSKWSDDPQETVSIFDGNANELSVSHNSYLGKYIAIYSRARSLVHTNYEIHMRTSNSPAGPWSKPLTIYRPQGSHRKDSCYAGKEHPEYSKDLGRTIYVTYVSHQRYFPELLEIEFEK